MKGVIESFEFLKGLPLAKYFIVGSNKDLEKMNFPYYLKADVIGHKNKMGAVLRCENLKQAKIGFSLLQKKFKGSKIVMQETCLGLEMLVGVKEDEIFGKMLAVGFGGVDAEQKKDVSFRALPVSRQEIKKMVLELKGKGSLKGYPLERFYSVVEQVVNLAESKNISELDLNPVIVGEKDVEIVDARVSV